MINTYECSKAGEKDSKSFWVGSIPTVRANKNDKLHTR